MTAAATRPPEADLHNHTRYSDGELSPEALVSAARRLGIQALGLTDHDTVAGLRQGLAAGAREDIQVIPGVEVSVRLETSEFRGTLHLLVYLPAPLLEDDRFVASAEALFAQGRGPALVARRVEAINAWFGPDGRKPRLPRPLTKADLERQARHVTRRHFALALGELGLGDPSAVTEIIGNDSPAYVPSGVPLERVSEWARPWPLVRVLAHPAAGSFPGQSHYKEVNPPLETVEAFLPAFLEAGLDGLEVAYPAHTPALQARVEALRHAQGLPLATGGSDCHDSMARPLGVAGVGMDQVAVLTALLEARLERWRAYGPPAGAAAPP